MGDIITIGDSLIITVFSMVIVFLTLLIISYLIDGLKVAVERDNNEEVKIEESIVEKEPTVEESSMEDEELVAVIAAAIAASEGVSIPQVKINTIRRVSKETPTWAKTGREEQIFNRL